MIDAKPRALKCERCGGRAEPWLRPATVVRDVIVFPSKWIQTKMCGKCEAEATAAEENSFDERVTTERLKWAGLGEPRFARMEFKNYRTDHVARERVAAMLRPIYSGMARTGCPHNVVLSGSNAGSGKTMLAVCLAKSALARGRRVRFYPWPELMLKLREASLSNKSRIKLEELINNDVLVLDDVGAEKVSDFVVENFYLIADRWWRADKQGLIITTNLSITELGQTYGDRVSSRLAGSAKLIDFEGCPDGRIENLHLES